MARGVGGMKNDEKIRVRKEKERGEVTRKVMSQQWDPIERK